MLIGPAGDIRYRTARLSVMAADPDATAIYLAPRERAGGGSEPGRLVDYAYDLLLTLSAGDNEVQIRGSALSSCRTSCAKSWKLRRVQHNSCSTVTTFGRFLVERNKPCQPRQRLSKGQNSLDGTSFFAELPPVQLIRYRREDQVGGRTVDVIEIIDVGGAPLRLYIDRESKDLLKQVYVGDVPGGGMAQVEETF